MKLLSLRGRAAFTVVEAMAAAAVTSIILAGVAMGAVALRHSYAANRKYIRDNANSARLIDYVCRDLRNAVQISLDGGVTPLQTTPSTGVQITGSTQLSIFVPSYYQTNIPDNSYQSPYKTGVYNRSNLPAGQTTYPYDTVTDPNSFPRTLKFLGNVQVVYLKKARSMDGTLCYYRQEYEGTTLRREDEIAEFGQDEQLIIVAVDSKDFQVGTSFASLVTGETFRAGSQQFSTVSIVNTRTDL
jgi:hypothetical protein